jgi:hypothetical protein
MVPKIQLKEFFGAFLNQSAEFHPLILDVHLPSLLLSSLPFFAIHIEIQQKKHLKRNIKYKRMILVQQI